MTDSCGNGIAQQIGASVGTMESMDRHFESEGISLKGRAAKVTDRREQSWDFPDPRRPVCPYRLLDFQ